MAVKLSQTRTEGDSERRLVTSVISFMEHVLGTHDWCSNKHAHKSKPVSSLLVRPGVTARGHEGPTLEGRPGEEDPMSTDARDKAQPACTSA